MFGKVIFRFKTALVRVVVVPKPNSAKVVFSKKVKRNRRPVLSDYRSTHMLIFDSVKFKPFIFRSIESMLNTNAAQFEISMQKLRPPVSVRGMTVLDKSKFDDEIKVPGVKIPMTVLRVFTKRLKKLTLKMNKLAPVVELEKSDPDSNRFKMILFDPRRVNSIDELTAEVNKVFEDENLPIVDIKLVNLKLSYDNWNFSEIMQAILPDDVDSVTGYSAVGHIAHFNLRDHALPFKHLIGQVLLDKIEHVKTVVNKLNTIDNTYRTFQMELMAGEDNFITQAKENGFVYELDFSKVYWNSRLSMEHERLTKGLSETDIVFDVFAGIGPFAIPAVKSKARVFANDLNPFSYESLLKNVKLNKCDSKLITCSNLDGREFINTVMKDKFTDIYTEGKTLDGRNSESISAVSVFMNLPAMAYTFLDAFQGLLGDIESFNSNVPLPVVHCHCFTNIVEATEKWDGDMNAELMHRFKDVLGGLLEKDLNLRAVRNVAPQKSMMCVSFRLSPEILCGRPVCNEQQSDDAGEPAAKCQKLS